MDYNAIPDIMAVIIENMTTTISITIATINIAIYGITINNNINTTVIVAIADEIKAKIEIIRPIIANTLDLLFFIAFTEIIRVIILNINGIMEGISGRKHKISAQIPKIRGSGLPASFVFVSASFACGFFN